MLAAAVPRALRLAGMAAVCSRRGGLLLVTLHWQRSSALCVWCDL